MRRLFSPAYDCLLILLSQVPLFPLSPPAPPLGVSKERSGVFVLFSPINPLGPLAQGKSRFLLFQLRVTRAAYLPTLLLSPTPSNHSVYEMATCCLSAPFFGLVVLLPSPASFMRPENFSLLV